MLLVPATFVTEALAAFPDECETMKETDVQTFYDEKAHAHEPDEEIDEKVLTSIKMKQDLGVALTPDQIKALDPEDETRGIRKNKRKKWADYKALKNISLK